MIDLFIYGSGSTGCELVDSVRRIQKLSPRWGKVFFVDDIRQEASHYGTSVWRFDEMLAATEPYECVIALGEPKHRRTLYEKLKAHNVPLGTVIDPTATISESAKIGPGCIIGVGTFVSCNTRLGDNVMLEIDTVVGHDIVVGEHSVISSCAVIGGHTAIGDTTFIGLNASIKERTVIGRETIIGMGAVVFHSVGSGLIALGNPARVIQKNQDGLVFKS